MSDKSKVENIVRDWSKVDVPPKIVKSTNGNIDLTEFTKLVKSMGGLSVYQAVEIYYGDNADVKSERQRKYVRHNICRKVWNAGDGEESVAIMNSGNQVYFVIPKSERKAWETRMNKAEHTIKIKS